VNDAPSDARRHAVAREATVCLNMIVKDELPVIRRCLESVAHLVDCWVVVDTGSTDGTQEAIRAFFAERGIPGVLHERPWRDFGHNRNEALELARPWADYAFVMDADDVFVPEASFRFGALGAPGYRLTRRAGELEYGSERLVRSDRPWRWHGVLHEYLACDEAGEVATLAGCVIDSRCEGARSRDPHKYRRDAQLLERELAERPGDPRTLFYLAQSYRDAGDDRAAVRAYKARAEAGGWAEEVYYSLYQIGCAIERLGYAWPLVLKAYLAAHAYRPTRLEALHAAARLCRTRGLYALGYQLALPAARLLRTDDVLFVTRSVVEWQLLDELSVCASWIGRWEQAVSANRHILAHASPPPEERARIERNLEHCLRRGRG